jgi:hypothetical protein
MSISADRADRHLAEQIQRLRQSQQRSFWPNYLYHTTHITNAISIVKAGSLAARNLVEGPFHDVANQDALAAFTGSHDYARLYFRPRNPYHIRTEGIKCRNHPFRQNTQASIPVTFLFDFKSVITKPGVKFTKGNIQRAKTALEGDESFGTLDFNAIYHDDFVTAQNKEHIHDCRMAEVLVPERLHLKDHLKAIFFRTRWDLETFRHLLQQEKMTFDGKVQVEQVTNSLYMHWGLYIIDMDFLENKIHLKFHLPHDYKPEDGNYKIKIEQNVTGFPTKTFDQANNLQNGSLVVINFHPEPNAIWTVNLEDVIAYQGPLPHAQSQIFGPKSS